MDNMFAKIFQKPPAGASKNSSANAMLAGQGLAGQGVETHGLAMQDVALSPARWQDHETETSMRAISALARHDPNTSGLKSALDAVGQQNESLRNHLTSILEGLSGLDYVRTLCSDLVDPLAHILKDTEESKKNLSEARAKYEFVHGAHEELKTQLSQLVSDKQNLADSLADAVGDVRRLDEALKTSEARLEETLLHLQDRSRRAEQLERDHLAATREGAALAEQILQLRTQLEEKEQAVLDQEQKAALSRDQYALLQNEAESLRANVIELTAQIGRVTRKANDIEGALERAKERISTLEGMLEEERASHASLKHQRDEEIERNNSEIAALTLKIEAVTSRADLTERLLNDARGKLRDKVFEMRTLERQLQEEQKLRENLTRKETTLDKDLSEQSAKVLELSTIRTQLNERLESAEKALRAKDAQLLQNSEKIETLEARLSESQKFFESKKQQLESLIAQLTEQFEKERMEKSLAEGALKTARLERQKMQRELMLLKTGVQLSGAKSLTEAENMRTQDTDIKDGDNVSRIFPNP